MVHALGNVFGGKYPAMMWNKFMTAATANLPPLDFTQPDEKLWPSSQYIDETGRHLRVIAAPPPPTLAPTSTPPSSAAKKKGAKPKPPKPPKPTVAKPAAP
jgi:membrane peptidoglycan carboxypeptidase